MLYERIKEYDNNAIRLFLYVVSTTGAYIIAFLGQVDYKGYGILMIAVFYFARIDSTMNTKEKTVLGLIQVVAMYIINFKMKSSDIITLLIFGAELQLPLQGLAILALPLIWLYNGKQGLYNKFIKNVYYWFYPVHLFILGIMMMIK